jgi:transposase-like protein
MATQAAAQTILEIAYALRRRKARTAVRKSSGFSSKTMCATRGISTWLACGRAAGSDIHVMPGNRSRVTVDSKTLTHPMEANTKSWSLREVCPRCNSPQYKKNGRIHNGKQNHQCKACGRQFVECFAQYFVSDETRGLIERLLLERLSLRGMPCRRRGTQVVVGFLVQCFVALPAHLHVQPLASTQDVLI